MCDGDDNLESTIYVSVLEMYKFTEINHIQGTALKIDAIKLTKPNCAF